MLKRIWDNSSFEESDQLLLKSVLVDEFKSVHTHTYTECEEDGIQDNITLR